MKTYIQITGGRGPVECARSVTLVARKLMEQFPNLQMVDYEKHNSAPGCLMSATLAATLNEQQVAAMRAEWEGSVLWISTQNPYRPFHKRKNWFVGVHFFTDADTITIDERDIRYETSRSSGHGGQNVNKVETAVKATHVPTGLSVRCEDERSQLLNKARAKERLILKLSAINDEKKAEQDRKIWMNHNTLERGNPVKTFRGAL